MQWDEELLASCQAGERGATVRLYTWEKPAVSIGRFQKIEQAVSLDACRARGIEVVRRATGGRAVFHHHELTYCIVAPVDHPLFPPSVLGAYKVIARGLVAGLRLLGVHAEMHSRGGRCAHSNRPGDFRDSPCFASSSWYEIVVNGRKLVGSAQRRLSRAFMQHGSILISFDAAAEAEALGVRECTVQRVTSLHQEVGGAVSLDEIKTAISAGFEMLFGGSAVASSVDADRH